MAQPTRSDDQAVRRRLSHNNLRRKKWRRRLPRAERKRPRRSGKFSAVTFRGARLSTPFFYPDPFIAPSCCSPASRPARRELAHEARSPNAGPTCQAAECAGERPIPQSTSEGRNPQWRRRLKAERRRRRRRGRFAARKKGDARASPFFLISNLRILGFGFWDLGFGIYCNVFPSQICTRRITSHGCIRSMTSMPFTTRPKTV